MRRQKFVSMLSPLSDSDRNNLKLSLKGNTEFTLQFIFSVKRDSVSE